MTSFTTRAMGRLAYMKSSLLMIPGYLASIATVMLGLHFVESSRVIIGFILGSFLFLVGAAGLVVLIMYGAVLTHRRLKDMLPTTDIYLVWGLYILASALTGGLVPLLLFVWPTKSVSTYKNAA